jgi:hypothetical protein
VASWVYADFANDFDNWVGIKIEPPHNVKNAAIAAVFTFRELNNCPYVRNLPSARHRLDKRYVIVFVNRELDMHYISVFSLHQVLEGSIAPDSRYRDWSKRMHVNIVE